MKQIQTDFGGGSITEQQLENVFHEWLPSQSEACHEKLDQFFAQWFDTSFPTPNNATNKPQITGPGINGPDNFYDDNAPCTRADQMISFGTLPDKFFDDPDFEVSATSDSGLPVSFAADGHCTISNDTVHLTGLGSCTITASQEGDNAFKPATILQTFEITKYPQTITFDPLTNKIFGDDDFIVSATASSGLNVSFLASGNCTISDSTVHITGARSCTVTATQEGDDAYDPAPDVQQNFMIIGYTFSGFSSPVENPLTVNRGKAGKTFPLKWQLEDGNGDTLTLLSAVDSITYKLTSCSAFTDDPTDALNADGPGKTDLNLTGDTYHYNWATPAKGCYTLFVNLANGTSSYAFFDLSK